MYAADDDPDELAAFGFLPEDYEQDTLEIWPENEASISLFSSVSTQWRVGSAGPIGLDYNVLFTLMDRMRLSPQEFDFMFEDIRFIENCALTQMNTRDK